MSAFFSYIWITLAVTLLLLDLWAITSIYRSDRHTTAKVIWSLMILALPFVGLVAWGVSGPRGVVEGPTSEEHSSG